MVCADVPAGVAEEFRRAVVWAQLVLDSGLDFDQALADLVVRLRAEWLADLDVPRIERPAGVVTPRRERGWR